MRTIVAAATAIALLATWAKPDEYNPTFHVGDCVFVNDVMIGRVAAVGDTIITIDIVGSISIPTGEIAARPCNEQPSS